MLSDADKRRSYDMGADPYAGGAAGFGQGFSFSDIMDAFFGAGAGQAQRGPRSRQRRGQDALIRLDIDLADAVFGAEKELAIETAVVCSTCHGDGAQPGTSRRTCDVCGGRGEIQQVQRSFLGQVMTTRPCATCQGYGEVLVSPCFECSGDGRVRTRRTLKIKVPAGVDTGTRIQLAGEGEVGQGGGPAGDLYVEVAVRPHETFQRRGDDLHCTVELPMTAAALGTTLKLDTFDGSNELEIKSGTQAGDAMTLRGLGRHPPARHRPWRPHHPRQRADPDPARRAAGGPAAPARRPARRGASRGSAVAGPPGPVRQAPRRLQGQVARPHRP